MFVLQNERRYLIALQENASFDDITFENFMEKNENDNLNRIIWILEGISEFIKSHLQLFGLKSHKASLGSRLRICMTFTERIRVFNFIRGAKWFKIAHHKDTGGASTAITQVAILPKCDLNQIKPEKQKWFLNDFLKSTLRGRRIEPGVAQNVLFDTKKAQDFVRAPSVFVSTGWVERRLSPSEILRCCDVPQNVDRSIIADFGEDIASAAWKSVMHAIPGKTALCVLRSLGLGEAHSIKVETKLNPPKMPEFQSMISGNFTVGASTQEEEINLKAVKADNAEVPVRLRNDKIVRGSSTYKQDNALEVIRNGIMLRWYRRSVFKSYIRYMTRTHGKGWSMILSAARQACDFDTEIHKDGKIGAESLKRILNASWWTWKAGSKLLFWRWAKDSLPSICIT